MILFVFLLLPIMHVCAAFHEELSPVEKRIMRWNKEHSYNSLEEIKKEEFFEKQKNRFRQCHHPYETFELSRDFIKIFIYVQDSTLDYEELVSDLCFDKTLHQLSQECQNVIGEDKDYDSYVAMLRAKYREEKIGQSELAFKHFLYELMFLVPRDKVMPPWQTIRVIKGLVTTRGLPEMPSQHHWLGGHMWSLLDSIGMLLDLEGILYQYSQKFSEGLHKEIDSRGVIGLCPSDLRNCVAVQYLYNQRVFFIETFFQALQEAVGRDDFSGLVSVNVRLCLEWQKWKYMYAAPCNKAPFTQHVPV